MFKSKLKDSLHELGFSENEARVYLALLNAGPTTAGPLISGTKLHRNIVYTSLDHLVGRKLVSEASVKGKKYFSITSPSILSTEFAAKAQLALQTADEIKKMFTFAQPEITVHQGNEEYLLLLTSLIKNMPLESTKYVFGTGGKAFMEQTMIPIWKAYHQVANNKKLTIKMLAYTDQKSSLDPYTSQEKNYQIRYLPSDMENPGGIHIYPEVSTVLNIIYSDENTPVIAIKIVHEALVQGYLNLFHTLWKQGRS